MSGCYGNSAYDRWLEARQDAYWSEMLVDDEEHEEEEPEDEDEE
jgi:hypothetical protein